LTAIVINTEYKVYSHVFHRRIGSDCEYRLTRMEQNILSEHTMSFVSAALIS